MSEPGAGAAALAPAAPRCRQRLIPFAFWPQRRGGLGAVPPPFHAHTSWATGERRGLSSGSVAALGLEQSLAQLQPATVSVSLQDRPGASAQEKGLRICSSQPGEANGRGGSSKEPFWCFWVWLDPLLVLPSPVA